MYALLLLVALAQHTPASTPPMPAEAAEKKFTVPEGFEVRLFAAEPDVVNPVGMAWDARGRLWVVELYEYPLGAPKGAKPRDQIKILEDTDGDGRADRVKVFADGLDLATGILLGHGGVFVGAAPDFSFLEDTDGDDVADRRTVLRTGFGRQDTHELLNGFAWGPDGWLYMTHGVFTHSLVKDPLNPNEEVVRVNAALARYHPVKKKFELFGDGTSNPWGVDFDRAGNAFVSACVIDHLFHISPGGIYARQGGTPGTPYAYEFLPSIVNHKHHRAAYCGVQVYEGDQFPAEYRGTILMGNIHQNAINRDRLTPRGSTFVASAEKDFLLGNDGWFRPVSTQVGPDGAVWIADWYDKYPCYQNAKAKPEDIDRKHGRIWRVLHSAGPKRTIKDDFSKWPSAKLVELLAHPNVWHRRTAQRLLTERRDPASAPALKGLRTIEALWTLHGAELLDEATLDGFIAAPEPAIRTWVARLTGERGDPKGMARLARLALDPDPSVRVGVAVAAYRLAAADTLPLLSTLLQQPRTAEDPLLPFMIWRAVEPKVEREAKAVLSAVRANGTLLRKAMRRISDTRQIELLDQAVEFLGTITEPALATAALDGLLEGQKARVQKPTIKLKIASTDGAVEERYKRLAAIWGDTSASDALIKSINDPKASVTDRLQGIRVARQLKTEAAREALLGALADPALVQEALRALGEVGGDKVAAETLKRWKDYSPETRRIAADVLASRAAWAAALLAAVERKAVDAGDISLSARRTLAQFEDAALRDRVTKVLGRYRESTAEKAKLTAQKKQVVLGGPVDFEAGRALAKKSCLSCHTLFGEGVDVGPDLTGVGRSTLDALLANVIDPNQIVGIGYENVIVKTKDERVVNGRLIEDTPDRVTLHTAEKKETIARANIEAMKVSELSVMPEGLEQMPDADFRNLVWYILSPPTDREARVRLEMRDKQLVVRARARDEWFDLVSYAIDPASRPGLHPVRDPSGRHVLTESPGILVGKSFVRLLDAHVATDQVGWTALLEGGEEQTIVVHAPVDSSSYEIDIMGKGNLSVRMAPDPKSASTKGTRAAWSNVERPFGGEISGIAVLDHPSKSRWKLLVHRGAARAEALDTASQRFLAEAPEPERTSQSWLGWRVESADEDGTPKVAANHAGREKSLVTHPFDRAKPAALSRELTLPAGRRATLVFAVASHAQGDWELRVLVSGAVVEKRVVAGGWKEVRVDLSAFAGRQIPVRLENAATGWSWEFGFWGDIDLKIE